jgi:hypothetical protein
LPDRPASEEFLLQAVGRGDLAAFSCIEVCHQHVLEDRLPLYRERERRFGQEKGPVPPVFYLKKSKTYLIAVKTITPASIHLMALAGTNF